MYSIAMKSTGALPDPVGATLSISWIVMMFGCVRADAAFASRINRRLRSASLIRSGGRTFMATGRPKVGVVSAIDHAHAACSELRLDAVVAEHASNHMFLTRRVTMT